MVRIKAMSVFEGVVYHSWCVDPTNPCRPTLEVDAVVGDGDLDVGPVLLPWADYVYMVGLHQARQCRGVFEDGGRIVQFLGVSHLSFPLWTPGDIVYR
jgi:hypothetical protein